MGKVILEMKSITKTFPGVKALDNVNLKVEKGEIHALVGENGAGKSTLMNVLSGIYAYGTYEGDIIYEGETCKFSKINDSESKGIVIIHQELALVPYMTIAENIFLGNERGSHFNISWDDTFNQADHLLEKVGLNESSQVLVKDIGVGKQQLVEIAKALAKNVKLLILDEPTASLNENDSEKLLNLLLVLKEQGITSILISHKLNEIAFVSDKITVLRDGKTIETLDNSTHEIDEERIIKGMVGRELSNRFPERNDVKIGEVSMEVKNWTVQNPLNPAIKAVDNVNLYVRSGEVVGIAGLMGAGRTELAMSLFGKSYGTGIKGELWIKGKRTDIGSVRQAIDNRLAYVTEDRKGCGLILESSVINNTTLAKMGKVSNFGVIDKNREFQIAEDYRDKLRIKCPTVEQFVGNLSGGNQQKVLLSKWMFAEPDIMILDEPTRGIDVGAKYEIYTIINQLAKEGKSILMISSELPEILGMCDRIYVMSEGKIAGELSRKEATQEKIMTKILKNG